MLAAQTVVIKENFGRKCDCNNTCTLRVRKASVVREREMIINIIFAHPPLIYCGSYLMDDFNRQLFLEYFKGSSCHVTSASVL